MDDVETPVDILSPAIGKLTKDLKDAIKGMPDSAARLLVDIYYQMQEDRKRSSNQTRAGEDDAEPHEVVAWLAKQHHDLEIRVRRVLDIFSDAKPLGQWARVQKGIGPVIAAGLLAHIDISKAKHGSGLWAFAGLDANTYWKGQADTSKKLEKLFGGRPDEIRPEHVAMVCKALRRTQGTLLKYAANTKGDVTWTKLVAAVARKPWNGQLKTLCWKLGESFVKVSGSDDAFYGKYYATCKADEIARNELGEYRAQAAHKLDTFKIGATTEAYGHYSTGKLPPAHLHARAKRRAVKLFLQHYFEVGFWLVNGQHCAKPWAIAHGGHTDYIAPPSAPWGTS